MRTNQPRRKAGAKKKQGRAPREPRPCCFMDPGEFAILKAANRWDVIEERYVRVKPGPKPTGKMKSSTERVREYRRRMRGE